ncbi:MAG: B12-binding domain-containing radical SAM protein, partial [Thermodesulfobacteriota bacterium]
MPLGLITVAALLPSHWQLRLVDLNTSALTQDDWEWADLVLLSAMGVQEASFLDLLRVAKARGKTVIAGGPYVSISPEEVLAAGCDYVVKGEAELLMPQLLEDLAQGKTGNIYESDVKPDLTISPVPRFDLLQPQDYLGLAIQTTRGCPFDCEFCDVVSLFGRKVRTKSPDQVIAELDAVYRLGGVKDIFFSDDNFVGNKTYARRLLLKIIPWSKERGEPFTFITQASVNLGHDQELLDLLTEANFNYIFTGVESPDEEVLQRAHKLQNVANPLAETLGAINANGLTLIASFILGLDGETRGAGDRIVDFVEDVSIPVVMFNMLFPLMKTRLWHRLRQEGRLREELLQGWIDRHVPEMEYYSQMFFEPSRPEEEIVSEYFRMVDRLYEPRAFFARAYRSILAMRPTRAAQASANGRPLPPAAPRAPKNPGEHFLDIQRLLNLIWKQGIKPSYRGQFWRQLYGVWRRNPSRLVRYLTICAYGQDLILFRERFRQYRDSQKAKAGRAETCALGRGSQESSQSP